MGSSEADRLKFAAAAEHAHSAGRVNPCGLFARIVAKGWWDFATLVEEEPASSSPASKIFAWSPPVGSPA